MTAVAENLVAIIDALEAEFRRIGNHKLTAIITISNKNWKKAALDPFRIFGDNFQHFLDSELSYNPTFHVFQPIFSQKNAQQKKEYLEQNRFRVEQLPKFRYVSSITQIEQGKELADRKIDAIVKYYDYRPGDLIEITRTNIFVPQLVTRTTFHRYVDR